MAKSFARFSCFARGRIVGKAEEGASRSKIRRTVRKRDGTCGSERAIKGILAKARANPKWEGEDSAAGGRPQELTESEQAALKKLMDEEVGVARVTIAYCRKRLPFLRRVSIECVRLCLHRLGLSWRLRRGKAGIAKQHKDARLAYCQWVLKQRPQDLQRWAYVDGTAWYLARTPAELEDKKRAATGKYSWRMATGEDSLEDKNVAASSYAKAQGLPIKIWGFFCDGHLEYYVLPKDYTSNGKPSTQHMNGKRYLAMVKKHFAKWRRTCLPRGRVFIVKDYERFLRNPEIVAAEAEAGCDQIPLYPKVSPDLNAIEGWWRKLKMHLDSNQPATMESRPAFLRRLRRAVQHLNKHSRAHGRQLCRNQKQRASECIKLKGARTRW